MFSHQECNTVNTLPLSCDFCVVLFAILYFLLLQIPPKMQRIIYFVKYSTAFDYLKAPRYYYQTDAQFILEPSEECLVILLHKPDSKGIKQLLFRGNEIILSNRKLLKLCLYVKNISTSLEICVTPGCSLESILKKSIVRHKLCYMNQKDLFRAEMYRKQYDNDITSNSDNDIDNSTDEKNETDDENNDAGN